ncbi:FMN-binding protein [Caproiciproducens galactitolivorans]|uniref:Ion-translocating oxidoreductase complex subunit G n=1 Tax=Caproiciproducens galactitolivorans TaxID=642589 RepID=A0A4Z0XW51_9FIRM|nr:FMN-binding protein [Caproiciproducens galactitolivorans]QEY33773.1 FMN-binding protein [Caproiciproducens galactitolivorans]TGJ75649.1 electron transport complex subunit RnfG [Caproiciproducens galactitolivorans]
MKVDVKKILKPAAVLCAICIVIAALLSVTNWMTQDKIKQINEETTAASRALVLPGAKQFVDSKNGTYAVGKNGNDVLGYVFTTKTKSYGGDLKVMTGIDKNGKVTGVVLLTINDTPGLGLNAQDESFRNQYLQEAPEKGFKLVKNGNAGKGQINAMTGATITSKAVTECVNEAVAQYQKIKEGK